LRLLITIASLIKHTTKKEFRQALSEEFGQEYTQTDANQILFDLVKYYRLLAKLNSSVESPQESQF